MSAPLCTSCGERPRRTGGKKKDGSLSYARECAKCRNYRYGSTPKGREVRSTYARSNKGKAAGRRHNATASGQVRHARYTAKRAARGSIGDNERSTGKIAEGLFPGFCPALWEYQGRKCAICGRGVTPAKFWGRPLEEYDSKTTASVEHRHDIWRMGQPMGTFWASISGLSCAACNAMLSANPRTGPRTRHDNVAMAEAVLNYLKFPPAQEFLRLNPPPPIPL